MPHKNLQTKNLLHSQNTSGESGFMFRQESQIYLGPLEVNPLSRIVPYFIILLCLTPDDFTRQAESAGG
jgi:hypothetical protein